jgi:hypothetical protein
VAFTVNAGIAYASGAMIWANWSGSVIGLQAGPITTPAIDPRNGMPVHPSDPTITLVGLIFVTPGGTMLEDGANQAVSSYWNRRPRTYSLGQSNATASGTTVPLHNPANFLAWADSADFAIHVGTCQLNTAGTPVWVLYINGVTANAVMAAYIPVANGQVPVSTNVVFTNVQGRTSVQLAGYTATGGSTASWTCTTYVHVMG